MIRVWWVRFLLWVIRKTVPDLMLVKDELWGVGIWGIAATQDYVNKSGALDSLMPRREQIQRRQRRRLNESLDAAAMAFLYATEVLP